MICRVGIPICAIQSRYFKEFLEVMGATAKVSTKQLRTQLKIYSDEVKAKNYQQVQNKFVTIITDGGTITDKEFYITVLFVDGRLYFAEALYMKSTNHDGIASALEPIIRNVCGHQGRPIAIVTDNARNLKLATTDSDQPGRTIDTSCQISSLQSRTGQRILHISCTIHSAHLVLTDLTKKVTDFGKFKKDMKKLFKFLREKKVRQKLKELGVKEKVNLIQEIKWLSFYQAFSFLQRFKSQVENVLADRTIRARKRPEFTTIPETWYSYLRALAPLGEFILETEKTDTRLCDVFKLLAELKRKWDEFDDDISRMLSKMMAVRFDSTADGLLMQLAYLFTPEGLKYFRRIFSVLDRVSDQDYINKEDLQRRHTLRDALMRKFMDLYNYYGYPRAGERVPPLFYQFVSQYELTADPMRVQLSKLRLQTLHLQTQKVPWCDFCTIAEILIELPASESIAERVISHMAALFPTSRYSSKPDLVDAQITIRAQEIFDEYNADVGTRSTI